jgi:hypothetical protein
MPACATLYGPHQHLESNVVLWHIQHQRDIEHGVCKATCLGTACCCHRYVGWFKEGQRHGEGTLYYSSGARYEGQWQRGKKHGAGVFIFEDGHVFRGHFLDDKPVLASGAVLGADSTFSITSATSSSTSSGADMTTVQLQQQLSAEAPPQTAAEGEQTGTGTAPGLLDSSSKALTNSHAGGSSATSGASKLAKSTPQKPSASKAAAPGSKAASSSANGAVEKAKAGAASTNKPPAAAKKPPADASTARAPAAAKKPPADAASRPVSSSSQTLGASKRASSAGSTSSTGSAAAAAAGKGSPANGHSTMLSSSNVGPSFGPASSVMQLYIADLLQEYEGPPAAVYKAVSNLLVGSNTELRLLYDRYRCASCWQTLLGPPARGLSGMTHSTGAPGITAPSRLNQAGHGDSRFSQFLLDCASQTWFEP